MPANKLDCLQWVETNPSNICVFPTDIHFYLTSWYYANGLQMSVYGCLRMLNGLVSSYPGTRLFVLGKSFLSGIIFAGKAKHYSQVLD